MRAVVAQRLVRRLCPDCSVPAEPPHASLLAELGKPAAQAQWRQAVGCPRCQRTGYQGRSGIYELVEVTEAIRSAILERKSTQELARIARQRGFRSLRQDGLIKAAAGLTSVDEVVRVTGLDAAET